MVSVILCTYNRVALLPYAIRSVQKQTFQDWQLIIIDDGSSDETRSIVRRFRKQDKRILYHFQTNKGLARARNTGLRRAQGSFVCFIDSDDEFTPSHISSRVRYLSSHKHVDLLHGGMRLLGPKKEQFVVDMTDQTKKIHLSKCHIGGTFFFRRNILKKVKGFNALPFGEDFDFYRRVERNYNVKKVRFPTYRYYLDAEDRLCSVFTEKLLQ